MSNFTLEAEDAINEIFDAASPSPCSTAQQPCRIPSSHSCPNLFRANVSLLETPNAYSVEEKVRTTHDILQEGTDTHYTSINNQAGKGYGYEKPPNRPAWYRFSRRSEPGGLSEKSVNSLESTRSTKTRKHNISGHMKHKQSTRKINNLGKSRDSFPPHLAYVAPLNPSDTHRHGWHLHPFTGRFNRETPVSQIIKLKEQLADHEEVKKKARNYSKRYSALLERFENLRQTSAEALMELEEDNGKKEAEFRAARALANRHHKISQYWERAFEREEAKVVEIKDQLDSVLSERPARLTETPHHSRLPAIDASTQTMPEIFSANNTLQEWSDSAFFHVPKANRETPYCEEDHTVKQPAYAPEGGASTIEDVIQDAKSVSPGAQGSHQGSEHPQLSHRYSGIMNLGHSYFFR